MGMKSTVRSTLSNRDEIACLANKMAKNLFDRISEHDGDELDVAKVLAVDIFTRELVEAIDYLVTSKEYEE